MQLIVVGVLALIGLLNAGLVQTRKGPPGSLEMSAEVNAWLFMKMFDINFNTPNREMMYQTSLFCGIYDPEYEQCLASIYLSLCRGHAVCSTFMPHLEDIDEMIDEKCGNEKPEDLLKCAREHTDECGDVFENSAECASVMTAFLDWLEAAFTDGGARGIAASRRRLMNGDSISLKEKRRLFEYLRSSMSK